MTRRAQVVAGVFCVLILHAAGAAFAQSGLSRAVQALPRVPISDLLTAIRSGRLYGGVINATIEERDRNPDSFSSFDCIDFTIASRDPNGPPPLHFAGPRSDGAAGCGGTQGTFEQWARDEARSLLAIIFPDALGASALGKSPGQLYAEQFLLTTALGTDGIRRTGEGGRTFAGGRVEFESLRRDTHLSGDSGWAVQGLAGLGRNVSIQGRFAQQREDFSTSAGLVSADFHPFKQFDGPVVWRVGGSARGGFVYSRAAALDLGSLEFGGGGWVSGFSDLGRVRLGGGTILQGAKSYVPGVFGGSDDDLGFLAAAINDRGILYDVAFGGTASVDTSMRTRVIGKVVQNAPISSRDARSGSTMVLAGLSYSLGLPTLNVGYRFSSSGPFTAHAVFFQGNYDW